MENFLVARHAEIFITVSSKRMTRTLCHIDIVRPMIEKNPLRRDIHPTHRDNREANNFNTRVFWITYFLSITLFFTWIMQ
jgi:hypothetical protein